MKPAPRPVRPPARLLAAAASVVAVSGAAVVGVPDVLRPDGLTARTIAELLADAAPDGARDIRVNGVYGSMHEGTWQFVASFTWQDTSGAVSGGTTELPQHGGQPPIPSQFDQQRIEHEHRIGWTVVQLRHALRDVDIGDADLAMLELAVTDEAARVVVCAAVRAGEVATCTERDRDGDIRRRFTDRLVDVPGWDAISVQRESAPITARS